MGRKIKHAKKIYRYRKRSKARSVISAVLTILVICALGVVGYGVGKPVMEFLRERGDVSSQISSFDPSASLSSSEPSSSSESSEPSSSEPPDAAGIDEQLMLEVPADTLADKAALDAYLKDAAADGYTAACVLLKDASGTFYYDTANETAKAAGAIASPDKLADLVARIEGAGLIPVARISTLQDPLSPAYDKALAVKFADGFTTWLDALPEKGGKRWISPFETQAAAFVSDITAELAGAGFHEIIYSALQFPDFHNVDYTLVSADYQAADRYTALVTVLTAGQNAAAQQDASVTVEVSAKRILEGKEDIFRADALGEGPVLVTFHSAELGDAYISDNQSVALAADMTGRVTQVFTEIAKRAGTLKIIPCIDRAGLTDAQLMEALSALEALGYAHYSVR